MNKTICVFCSSSDDLDKKYQDVASELGKRIAMRDYTLIHGAGSIGLMGHLMKSCHINNGKVVGVVPKKLHKPNIVSDRYQTLVVTEDMKIRKEYMRDKSDAFITLAGGFGTVEELMETITLKQLKYHNKPIVIINSYGFFNSLFNLFEEMYKQNFADTSYRELYKITESVEEALEYIDNYEAKNIFDKYLDC